MASTRTTLKTIATVFLSALLHPRLVRPFFGKRITILMYHGVIDSPLDIPDVCMVSIENFRLQMQYLKNNFNVVSLPQAARLLREDCITEPTVVITFDDGYQNNFDLAYPVLDELGLPATIFVSTGFTDTDQTVGTQALHNAFLHTQKKRLKWRNQEFNLASNIKKQESLNAIKSTLKQEPQHVFADEVARITSQLGDGAAAGLTDQSPYRMLTSDSLQKLNRSNLIDIGAHTHTHSILSRQSPSEQEREIHESLDCIESATGKPCLLFAYPNGMRCDYDEHSVAILRNRGVTTAVTTESGTCDADSSLLELPRIAVSGDAHISSFKLSVIDFQGFVRRLIGRLGQQKQYP